ncbi:MAG TPA: LysM peptidoglycan-binding domain-containing protein [Myxococcota bacterium]|nr:LysM peptidoglycan-binding domain-containing protein [Myxococcota bacterium]
MSALRPITLALGLLVLPALGFAQEQGEGVTPDGRKGQIYKVQKGDTLWSISQRYLGTPWIWPSVWKENEAKIANPHWIYPGDLIWISEGSMRKLTPEEAARLAAAGQAPAPEPAAPAAPDAVPAPAPPPAATEQPDPFASLDAADVSNEVRIDVPTLQGEAFVTAEEMKATGAIMGNHDENVWLAQGQRTILSVGEGQGHVGDAYTVFRVRRELHHPVTGEKLGYFVQVLGKAEITQLYPETSWARIITSYAEIQPGDRVLPFVEEPTAIVEVRSGQDVRGQIVAFEPYRQRTGAGDFVVLDAGTKQGMVPGRRLQAFRPAKEVRDPLTQEMLVVPDDVLGEMFVVKSGEITSLALVMKSERDLHVGDSFRSVH